MLTFFYTMCAIFDLSSHSPRAIKQDRHLHSVQYTEGTNDGVNWRVRAMILTVLDVVINCSVFRFLY